MELDVQRGLESQIPPTALQPSPSDGNGQSNDFQGINQQLKPADGGAAAWKVLFAAFMFEALLWGKPCDCLML